MKAPLKNGFTLIELMIVVAIIGILAAVAMPKFSDLINKSHEGATKGGLSSIRGALRVYYGDNEGLFPSGPAGSNATFVQDAIVPKYLSEWPSAYVPRHHRETGIVDAINGGDPAASYPADDGNWVYVSSSGSSDWGRINVKCYHADLNGGIWSTH